MGNQGRIGDRFRKTLKDERKRRDWSQEDVAKMLLDKGIHGIYPTTIAKIEAGDRAVRVDELVAFADLLGVPLDRLLGRDTSPQQELKYTLENIYATARHASSELTATEESLRALTGELTGFDFDRRDHLVALGEGACDALARAGHELRTLYLSPHFMAVTQEKYMAETAAQLSWYPAAAPLLEMMTESGDDETQS